MSKIHRKRLSVVIGCTLLVWFLLGLRLVSLQWVQSARYRQRAQQQHQRVIVLDPQRGHIYDRNGRPLAINLQSDSFWANPHQVDNPDHAARVLARLTGISPTTLRQKLAREASFVWLTRQIDPEASQAIQGAAIVGLYSIQESKRVYPEGTTAGQTLGFVNIDGIGLEGVELQFNDLLSGTPGQAVVQVDANGRRYPSLDAPYTPSQNGVDVALTIDATFQQIAEEELVKAVKTYHARSGMVILLDPHSGEVLALVNVPLYDPNRPDDFAPIKRKNRAITDVFEPGSTFKLVAAVVALEQGVMRPDDLIFCHNGALRVAGQVIHDHKPYGWLTFQQVIEKSSNIGIIKIAQKLDKSRFYDGIRRFGFGSRTGIDFPGEVRGILRKPPRWSGRTLETMAMGQEIAVTAIQLASAFGAVANGGHLIEPVLLKATRPPNGVWTPARERPRLVRRVMRPETARQVNLMLNGVVRQGTGQKARIKGYSVAGKTGTAQKPAPHRRGYLPGKYIASFVGYLPSEAPRILGLVVLDEPTPYYGGEVAAPTFKRIMERIISSPSWATHFAAPAELPPGLTQKTGTVFTNQRPNPRTEGQGYSIAANMALVPDVTGFPLRQAVRILSQRGIIVTSKGSGLVVRQSLSAGRPVEPGMRCTLECRPKDSQTVSETVPGSTSGNATGAVSKARRGA